MSKLLSALVAAAVAAAPVILSPETAQAGSKVRRIAIEYRDLSGTQDLSAAPFVSHSQAFRLWEEGKSASLLIQELAENGNPEFVLGTAVGDSKTFLDEAVGVPNHPGKGRRLVLKVDAERPLISGGWMLGRTNDGFTGIEGVNAYALKRPVTIDVYPLDAGTEVNSEKAADLPFLGGLGRTAENGVIRRHPGVQGNGDIPAAAKFDPAKPVGRVVLTPLN